MPMKTWLSVLIAISLTCQCLGQMAAVEVAVTKVKAIEGVSAARVVGDLILVSDESKPIVSQVAILQVKTQAKFVRIKARKSLFEFGQVDKLGENEWVLSGAGRYAVEVTAFDPELGIEETAIEVELGESPAPPEPTPPGPQPGPVPPDAFSNLGQRVAATTAGLPKRANIAAVYRASAKTLREEPSVTVASVVEQSARQRNEILGTDSGRWTGFADLLTSDLKSRWPMAKGTLADWMDAIATGLESQPVRGKCTNEDCMCDMHGPLSDPCPCGSSCSCGVKK